jgi:hypothetical protein
MKEKPATSLRLIAIWMQRKWFGTEQADRSGSGQPAA